MGIETARLVSPDEIKKISPITDVRGILGGPYDFNEGHLDPYGTTHAYVAAARARGADLILRNRVLELVPRREGGWSVVTEQGTSRRACRECSRALGEADRLDGRRRLAGNADAAPLPRDRTYSGGGAADWELALTVDLEGFTHPGRRVGECSSGFTSAIPGTGMSKGHLGDYGLELIPEEVDRIMPELAKGFERFPCLNEVGIKTVNGAFTFTPDGNPLVGPVEALEIFG